MPAVSPLHRQQLYRWRFAAAALALCSLAASAANAQDRVHCPDGTTRNKIDLRQIAIQYQGASFAGTLSTLNVFRMRLVIEERTLQRAAAATQEWNEFLKGLVGGWNSCVITAKQYEEGLKRIYPRLKSDIVDLERLTQAIANGQTVNERRLTLLLDRYFSNLQRFAQLAGQNAVIERVIDVVDRRADDILRSGEKNTNRIIERIDRMDKRAAQVPSTSSPKDPTLAAHNNSFVMTTDAGARQPEIAPSLRMDLAGGLTSYSPNYFIDFAHGGMNATAPPIISILRSTSFDARELGGTGMFGPSTFLNAVGVPTSLGNAYSLQPFGNLQSTTASALKEPIITTSLANLSGSDPHRVALISGLEPAFGRLVITAGQQTAGSLHISDALTGKDKDWSGAILPSPSSDSAHGTAFSNIVAMRAVENIVDTGGFFHAPSGASPGTGTRAPTTFALTGGSPVIHGDLGVSANVGGRLLTNNLPDQGVSDFRPAIYMPPDSMAGVTTTVFDIARFTGVVPSYNALAPSLNADLLGQENLARLLKYTDKSLRIDQPCR
jgi:hypothetical protein